MKIILQQAKKNNVKHWFTIVLVFCVMSLPTFLLARQAHANIIPILQILLLGSEEATDAPDECGNPLSPVLSINGMLKGDLEIGDHDYIKISTRNFYTNVKLYTTGTTDTFGELYDATDCNQIIDDDDDIKTLMPNQNRNFLFEYNLEPGKTYYLNVRGYSVTTTEGEYSVFASQTDEYVYLSALYDNRLENLSKGVNDPVNNPHFDQNGYPVIRGLPNAYDSLDESYYYTVDPNNLRTTLSDWKQLHGFNVNQNDVINAEYINAYDLALGRKMSCLPDSILNRKSAPCVVDNYTIGHDPDSPGEPELIASVAMERIDTGNRYYTAFFVFDPSGKRINSIDLDGSGPKRVPEVCWSCHDGKMVDTDTNPANIGSHGGQYLPFDVNLFKRFPGGATLESQSQNFRDLNWGTIRWRVIANASIDYDDDAHDGVRGLLGTWYQRISGNPAYGPNLSHYQTYGQNNIDIEGSSFSKRCVLCHTPPDSHGVNGVNDDRHTPDRALRECKSCHNVDGKGVIGYFQDYRTASFDHTAQAEFYGQYCQTCHVAQKTNNNGEFKCEICHEPLTSTQTTRPPTTRLTNVLCDVNNPLYPHMPNAKVTHARFLEENFQTRFGDTQVKVPSLLSNMGYLDNKCSGLNLNGYRTEIYPKNINEGGN